MRATHLVQKLDVAKRITERAAAFDSTRARVELGGYIETLILHPVGRALVRHWAVAFRRELDAMDNARNRVVERLREVRDIILAAYMSCSPTLPDLDKVRNGLESLERSAEAEWLGPQGDTPIDLSILFEPLN